jgi:hypothetical protein
MYVVKWADATGNRELEFSRLELALEWSMRNLDETHYEIYKTGDPPSRKPFLSRLFGG